MFQEVLGPRAQKVYWSEDACKYEPPDDSDDFIPGYEIEGLDPPKDFGGGGFYAPSPGKLIKIK